MGFAAIHIPNFSLAAQIRHRPELEFEPVALLDPSAETSKTQKERGRARILQRTKEAAEKKVELGMTAVQGQARCAWLTLIYPNTEDETAAQSDLLDCAGAFSPDFENTEPGTVIIDLFSNPQPPKKVGQHIIDWLAAVDLPAQVGFADNPDLALLLAKWAQPIQIANKPETARQFLASLPITALEPDFETKNVLTSWGVTTLSDFTTLPRHEITLRLGPAAGELWDHASGTRQRLLKLERPPADYTQRASLEFEITAVEPLLFLLNRLLEKIVARLAANYLVAEQMILTLEFENGTTHERTFRVPDPCAELSLLFGMLEAHLDGFVAKSPIAAVELDVVPTKANKHQFHLFESSLRDPNRFADTLARLEALLGSTNVGTPELSATYRADAFRLFPFVGANRRKEDETPEALPAAPFLGLPLRRFRPARPATVTLDREKRPSSFVCGSLTGRIVKTRGPWLSSGDWWDRFPWARQDWDVQLDDGVLYRLYREKSEWRLEGAYG